MERNSAERGEESVREEGGCPDPWEDRRGHVYSLRWYSSAESGLGQVSSVSAWEQCHWGCQEHGLILIQNRSLQFLITDSIALTNKMETREGRIRR